MLASRCPSATKPRITNATPRATNQPQPALMEVSWSRVAEPGVGRTVGMAGTPNGKETDRLAITFA